MCAPSTARSDQTFRSAIIRSAKRLPDVSVYVYTTNDHRWRGPSPIRLTSKGTHRALLRSAILRPPRVHARRITPSRHPHSRLHFAFLSAVIAQQLSARLLPGSPSGYFDWFLRSPILASFRFLRVPFSVFRRSATTSCDRRRPRANVSYSEVSDKQTTPVRESSPTKRVYAPWNFLVRSRDLIGLRPVIGLSMVIFNPRSWG
uniref:Uncharacterized protein n=1 Tax=Steinernema glaseri TaxID=37863 RepID=A0A1I7Z7P7_9BILA